MKLPLRLWLTAALGLLGACASPGPDPDEVLLSRKKNAFTGFQTTSQHYGGFRADANLLLHSEREFGEDLIEEYGIVPIRVTVACSGEESVGGISFQISSKSMAPNLFLQNGFVLKAVDIATLRGEVDEDSDSGIDGALFEYKMLIKNGSDRGALFFRLPKESRVEGGYLYYTDQAGYAAAVDLRKSLLSFTYVRRENNTEVLVTMNVGLQS